MVPDENGRVSLVDTVFLISKFQFHVLVRSVSSFLSAGYILWVHSFGTILVILIPV